MPFDAAKLAKLQAQAGSSRIGMSISYFRALFHLYFLFLGIMSSILRERWLTSLLFFMVSRLTVSLATRAFHQRFIVSLCFNL
jgi:hypothetical protein